jgi:hypothetical protein
VRANVLYSPTLTMTYIPKCWQQVNRRVIKRKEHTRIPSCRDQRASANGRRRLKGDAESDAGNASRCRCPAQSVSQSPRLLLINCVLRMLSLAPSESFPSLYIKCRARGIAIRQFATRVSL